MPTHGNRGVRYDSFKDTRHLQPTPYVIVHSAIALTARKCGRRDPHDGAARLPILLKLTLVTDQHRDLAVMPDAAYASGVTRCD